LLFGRTRTVATLSDFGADASLVRFAPAGLLVEGRRAFFFRASFRSLTALTAAAACSRVNRPVFSSSLRWIGRHGFFAIVHLLSETNLITRFVHF
jgi:hypothetical protein